VVEELEVLGEGLRGRREVVGGVIRPERLSQRWWRGRLAGVVRVRSARQSRGAKERRSRRAGKGYRNCARQLGQLGSRRVLLRKRNQKVARRGESLILWKGARAFLLSLCLVPPKSVTLIYSAARMTDP